MADSDLTLEQKIEVLQQQLAQSQRLAALGELTSTTTHEFNNILMTIVNYAQMGQRHKDEATRDKALNKIFACAQKATKLTASILGMARNRSNSFEPTDLAQMIEETLVLLERELTGYRISVEKQIGTAPKISAIGNQLQQVLLNLLINARQAMTAGGRILIKLDHDAASNTVDLIVRDSGSGIAPDKLRKIFDPFFTTKAGPDETGKGGTGLGLSSCLRIIESHKGRIRVESTVGKGTQFIIRLPVSQLPLVAPAPLPVSTSTPHESPAVLSKGNESPPAAC